MAAADPTLRKFPTSEHKEFNLTTPADLQTKGFTHYYHANCPYASHKCPRCDRNFCHTDSLIVAVDGACPNNGQGATKSAVGVFLRYEPAGCPCGCPQQSANLFKRVPDVAGQPHTNQRAELHAAIAGLDRARPFVQHGGQWDCDDSLDDPGHGPLPCTVKHMVIKSDSKYLVDGMTDPGWVKKWLANGWLSSNKKPVQNRDLWEELLAAVASVERDGAFVSFWHVSRADNVEADQLANKGLEVDN